MFTFEQLPQAVEQLFTKLESIEKLLLEQSPDPASNDEQLLTIQDAANVINLTIPTIYGLVSKSQIPFCKKGKRLYFLKSELLDWIKSGRKKTQAEIEAEAEKYITRKAR